MTATRRAFLAATAAAAQAQSGAVPIIDTHFHLYDPRRPQGVPYPKTPNPAPFLPRDFRESAVPLGIVGGIKVEASPWVEDNLWVLMTIEDEPMIVGMVGNLDPLDPRFPEYLDRYHRNRLFLGIRYGNIWDGHDIVAAVHRPEFIGHMKTFAQTGLTFEVANPRLDLVEATLRLAGKVPELRIVLGHLQALPVPADAAVRRAYVSNLEQLREYDVYVKVSGLPRTRPGEQPPADVAAARPMLDLFWDTFGEDRIVYAGRSKAALDVLREYTMAKGRGAAEKFFWQNSVPAFRWVRRDANQPESTA
ncbi:MAG: amidohydrolase family protein [Bryobacteraceae bacterium]